MEDWTSKFAGAAASGGAWSRRGLSPASVGIIGVSRRTARDRATRSRRLSTLDHYARLVNEGTVLRAVALELTGPPALVAVQLSRRVFPMSAAFLIGLDAQDAAEVRDRVADAGGPLIVSFTDAFTTAHAATVLAALESLVVVRRARVALADASACPLLGPILVGSGVAELTYWRTRDGTDYPYRLLHATHDVVIHPDPTSGRLTFGDVTLRLPDPIELAAFVIPGLLGALCGHGTAVLRVEHLIAAARGIAAVTPVWQTLPAVDEPLMSIAAIARQMDATVNRPPL